MKSAHFDCFSGISGDMTVGALIDSGLEFEDFEKMLRGLNISGYEISAEKILKNGIGATKFDVKITAEQSHRDLKEITSIISKSSLNEKIKNDSIGIFTLLATAEASVHMVPIDKIHFHEVGALDSIIDICGTAIAINMLNIGSVTNSPVNIGKGFVKTAHGILPVPAPATAELLKNIEIFSGEADGELTTPTGAAILAFYSSGTFPSANIKASNIGYGAGTKDLPIPNLLRVFISENQSSELLSDSVVEIETSIDDMNPEIYSYLFDILFEKGAIDASIIPALTKKSRPVSILKILTHPDNADILTETVFRETTTSGIRIGEVKRKILERHLVPVETAYGIINVKFHYLKGEIITISPEYEECRNAAITYNVPLKEVYLEAQKKASRL